MADMAQYDDCVQAWDSLHQSLRERSWNGRVIPITYVNSSAAIKAFVGANGGACCTSSNARSVFDWAMAGGTKPRETGEGIKMLFLPDQHLGRNTAASAGLDVSRQTVLYDPRRTRQGDELAGIRPEALQAADVILWAGHCSVHKLFRPEHCDQIRAEDAKDGTQTSILVHPECSKEVVDKADLSGSTEFIIKTIESAPVGSRWVIGTEVHLVARLAKSAAARNVHVRILSDCQCLCTTMYRIDQPHMLWVLDNLVGAISKDGTPKVVNQIRVHPEVRRDALLAIERMLAHVGSGQPFVAAHSAVD